MILTTLKDTIFENISNSDGLFTRHFHETYTIGITHGGRFKSVSSEKASFSYKNSTRVINPSEVHYGDSSSWQYTNIYPRVELLVELYKQIYFEKRVPIFHSHIIEDEELYKKLYIFFKSVFEKTDSMQIETYLIEAFSYLILNYTDSSKDFSSLFNEVKVIKNSIEYIHDNLNNTILLDEIAKNVEVSKYHFLRVFKSSLGVTPHNYIVFQRVNKAKEEILKGKSMSSTSFSTGFSDQSHFIKSFRKIYGYSPSTLLNSKNYLLYK